MFCTHCGTKLSDDCKFCYICGNAVLNCINGTVNTESSENPYSQIYPHFTNNSSNISATEHIRPESKPNPFTFISAGIMSIMLLLYFLPWIFIDEKCVSLLSYFISRSYPEYSFSPAMVLFLIFMFIAIGLMIPGIILAIIRKNRMPMVFAITSAVSIHFSMFFFMFTEEAWTIGISITPMLIFLLSYVSIAFAIPAKIK